jgi:hypothetical protein
VVSQVKALSLRHINSGIIDRLKLPSSNWYTISLLFLAVKGICQCTFSAFVCEEHLNHRKFFIRNNFADFWLDLLSTKEIKFVCISEFDTNLLVDNVHPSFAGVVLFQLYFMTRTGIQTIHFVGQKDDILGWAKKLD